MLCFSSSNVKTEKVFTLWGFFTHIPPDTQLHIHKKEHNLKKYVYKYEVDFKKLKILFDILKLALLKTTKTTKKGNFKYFNFPIFMSIFSTVHSLIKS